MTKKILTTCILLLCSAFALAGNTPKVVVHDYGIDSYMGKYRKQDGVTTMNISKVFLPMVKDILFKQLKKQTPASIPAMKVLMKDTESAKMMNYDKAECELHDQIETSMYTLVGVQREATEQKQFLFAAAPSPDACETTLNRIIMYDGDMNVVVVFSGCFTREALDAVLAFQKKF